MPSEKVNLTALKGATVLAKEASDEQGEPRTRFTVDLLDSDHHFLKLMALESRTTMSDLIRGAVKLMREQEGMAGAVSRRAKRL